MWGNNNVIIILMKLQDNIQIIKLILFKILNMHFQHVISLSLTVQQQEKMNLTDFTVRTENEVWDKMYED